MLTIILAILAFCVLFAAMALGVILSNRPIRGSCGGLKTSGLGDCELCGGKPEHCKRKRRNQVEA